MIYSKCEISYMKTIWKHFILISFKVVVAVVEFVRLTRVTHVAVEYNVYICICASICNITGVYGHFVLSFALLSKCWCSSTFGVCKTSTCND